MIALQRIMTSCPACRSPVTAEVANIIDAGQDPELRRRLLSGRLNSTTCPNCGRTFQVVTPIMYNDGSKEFLGVFLTPEVNLNTRDRQRIIGDLNRRLMDSLPPEQRRAYLFQPKEFLTLNGMIEAVLAAEGITPEMQRAQRQRGQLIDSFLRGASSEESLRTMARENDAQLDYEFFATLAMMAEQAATDGDERAAGLFAALHQELLSMSSFGQRIQAQQQAAQQINERTTRDELLEKIIGAGDDEFEVFVAAGRPLIDYAFYQKLTDRIQAREKAGDKAEATRLTQLRQRLLDLTAQLDEEARAVAGQAADLLQHLVQDAEDPVAELEDYWDEIDETFLEVLSLNISAAQQRGATQVVGKLTALMNAIMEKVEASQPPEIRLINDLLRAEYPGGTRKMLSERRADITPDTLQAMDMIAQNLDQDGRGELAKRLRDVRTQAALLA